MIIDSLLEFSKKQNITASALSDNVSCIFTEGSPNKEADIGNGEPVWLVVSLVGGGAAPTGKLSVELLTDTKSDMSTAQAIATSGELDVASVKAGQPLWAVRLPSAKYKKYIALRYKPNGALANVIVNAFITKDADANVAHASGVTVL